MIILQHLRQKPEAAEWPHCTGMRLQMQPSFNWMLAFCSEVRRRIDLFTARELATLIWACIK